LLGFAEVEGDGEVDTAVEDWGEAEVDDDDDEEEVVLLLVEVEEEEGLELVNSLVYPTIFKYCFSFFSYLASN